MRSDLHKNLSTRAAIQVAGKMGIRVWKNATGELVFDDGRKRERQKGTRQDVSRKVLSMLRRAERSDA